MRSKLRVSAIVAIIAVASLPDLVARAAAAAISWTKFEDPFEHAFTIDVPQGWAVKGGLFRIGYSDVRPMVDMTSPDGKTEIRLGDLAIPTYALPTPQHPPGDAVDLGAQAQMTSARYHTGEQFATVYAQTHFIRVCQRLDPQPNEGEPPVNDDLAKNAQAQQSTTGQVTYKCSAADGQRTAYAYSRTNLMPNLWQVSMIASFITPSDRGERGAQPSASFLAVASS